MQNKILPTFSNKPYSNNDQFNLQIKFQVEVLKNTFRLN